MIRFLSRRTPWTCQGRASFATAPTTTSSFDPFAEVVKYYSPALVLIGSIVSGVAYYAVKYSGLEHELSKERELRVSELSKERELRVSDIERLKYEAISEMQRLTLDLAFHGDFQKFRTDFKNSITTKYNNEQNNGTANSPKSETD